MNNIFTLESWLQIATNDLTPEAVVSIRKEITDHVKTTLEYQTNAGLSQVEAEKVAVTLLGDPKKLAKKFNRTYLTKKDEEALQRMRKSLAFYITLGLVMLWFPANYFLESFQFIQRSQVGFLSYFSDLRHIYLLLDNLNYLIWSILILTSSFAMLNLKNTSKIRLIAVTQPILILLSVFCITFIVILLLKKLVYNQFNLGHTLHLAYISNLVFYGIMWFSFYSKIRKISTRATT